MVGCKWTFRIKRHPDGRIPRYKARLVAKGYHQRLDLDYHDTFSPVVKPITNRIVLCITLTMQWQIYQLDVNNAFLHGVLDIWIYMHQPTGYIDATHPFHLCQLKKALYDLK